MKRFKKLIPILIIMILLASIIPIKMIVGITSNTNIYENVIEFKSEIGTVYTMGQLVYYDGNIYRVLQTFTYYGDPNWHPGGEAYSLWEFVSQGTPPTNNYSECPDITEFKSEIGTVYTMGQLVYYDGNIYRVLQTFTYYGDPNWHPGGEAYSLWELVDIDIEDCLPDIPTTPTPPPELTLVVDDGYGYDVLSITIWNPEDGMKIYETDRNPHHYINMWFKFPILNNLITIERETDEGSFDVSIKLIYEDFFTYDDYDEEDLPVYDIDYIPYAICVILPNGDTEIYPSYFDKNKRVIEFTVTGKGEFTFVPVVLPPSDINIIFKDSGGNIHTVTDINVWHPQNVTTIYESDRKSSDYIDIDIEIPMIDNLITIAIEREIEMYGLNVSIQLMDDDFMPQWLIAFFPNGGSEIYPFFFDQDERTISFNIRADVTEFTFMPVALATTPQERMAMTRDFDIRGNMFNIVENSGGRLEVHLEYLENYPQDREYYISRWPIEDIYYMVTSSDGRLVQGGGSRFISLMDYKIILNNLPQGVYTIELAYNINARGSRFRTIWKQDVFIEGSQKAWTESEIKDIAERFAPIIVFHPEEEFFPVSFDYLFGRQMPASMRDVEMIISGIHGTTNRFNNAELINILPFNGSISGLIRASNNRGFRFDMRGSPQNATIYYSYIEGDREVYINYHMFYAFDPKDAPATNPGIGSHVFDRESFTIVFNKSTKEPVKTIYPAHLQNHTIRLRSSSEFGASNLQSWTGRVTIPFYNVLVYENRPIISIARGGHGVFPVGTNYRVYPAGFGAHSNGRTGVIGAIPANDMRSNPQNNRIGRNIIVSPSLNSNFNSYELKRLDLAAASDPSIVENVIAFSGSFVDLLGSNDAKFPPFTERERDAQRWVADSTDVFNWNNINQGHIDSVRTVNAYLTRHIQEPIRRLRIANTTMLTSSVDMVYTNNNIEITIPFQSVTMHQGGRGFTFVDVEKFFNLLNTVANTSIDGTVVNITHLHPSSSNIDFEISVNTDSSVASLNSAVYATFDGRVYAHIRYLADEYNRISSNQRVDIDFNTSNSMIYIRF